jgi:hypothetical protein
MNYKSFIKKSVAAAVAGGSAYLAAKYSGHNLDAAIIAASAKIVMEEAEDLATHAHREAEKKQTAKEPVPETVEEKPAAPSVDCQGGHKSMTMRLH